MKDKLLMSSILDKYDQNVDLRNPISENYAPVYGTNRKYNNTTEGGFTQDVVDYYKYAGGNQTAEGIVSAITAGLTYGPRDTNLNINDKTIYNSLSPEFKLKYTDQLVTARNESHLTDMVMKFKQQEAVEQRILDPNYDASDVGAILGSVVGSVFDASSFIPIATFGVSKRLGQLHTKLGKLKQGAAIRRTQSEIKAAQLLGAASTGAQFSAAEYIRETTGQQSWVRPDEEVAAQIAIAGLFGGALHSLVAAGGNKAMSTQSPKVIGETMEELSRDATKVDIVPGEEIAYSAGFGGTAAKWVDRNILGSFKPNVALATNKIDAFREFGFSTTGTAFEVKKGSSSPGIIFDMDTITDMAVYDMTNIKPYFNRHITSKGKLDEAGFRSMIKKVERDNDGLTLDEFVSSGHKEVDDFYLEVSRPTNKKLLLQAQEQGLLKGVDPENGFSHRSLDPGKAIIDPGKSQKAIAASMKSADTKRLAAFNKLGDDLKQIGLKLDNAGRLLAKNIDTFRALVKGTDGEIKLNKYLNMMKKSTGTSEDFDLNKLAPSVKSDYTNESEALYRQLVGEVAPQEFEKTAYKASLAERQGNLDWELLEDLMPDDYGDDIMLRTRSLVRDTQVQKYLGDPDGKMSAIGFQRKKAFEQYQGKLKEVEEARKSGKLSNEEYTKEIESWGKEYKNGLKNLDGVVNRMYDRAAYGNKRNGWTQAIKDALTAIVNVPLLGASVLAQINDLINVLDYKWVTSLSHLDDSIKRTITSESLGINDDIITKVGLKPTGISDKKIRLMHGDSYDSNLYMSKDVGILGISPKGVSDWARSVMEKGFKANFMTFWNNYFRADLFKGNMVTITELAIKADSKGLKSLNAESKAFLKEFGITDALLTDLASQYKISKNMNNWNDELVAALSSRIKKQITNKGVIEPHLADKPLVMDSDLMMGFGMLKGFLIASSERYFARDIRSGVRGFNRSVTRVALGSLIYMLRSSLGTKDGPDMDPANLLLEGIMRSGSFAGLDFISESLDFTLGAGAGSMLGVGRANKRFYDGNTGMIQLLVGPSATIMKDFQRLSQRALQGKLDMRDAVAMSRYHYALSPFYINYPLKELTR